MAALGAGCHHRDSRRPVAVSLTGSEIDRLDALFAGWLGPRGPALIVFAMRPFIDLGYFDRDLVCAVSAGRARPQAASPPSEPRDRFACVVVRGPRVFGLRRGMAPG
jgi:hypothetical protein